MLYKDIYIAKINIFFNIFYCRNSNNNLIVIIRVKEFYFSNILFIRISIFCSFCRIRKINKINKINRIKYCTNFINKILKSILLLLRKIDILSKDIRYNNRQ